MTKKYINIPEMVTITISGPTQTGKSIIMERISQILEKEFRAEVVSPQLRQELNGNDYTNLATWQKDMIKNTVWYLQETGELS